MMPYKLLCPKTQRGGVRESKAAPALRSKADLGKCCPAALPSNAYLVALSSA